MKQNNIQNNTIDLAELTSNLKEKDKQYALLSKRFQVVYWILIPIYVIMIVVHITEKEPLNYIIGSSCFLVAMLMFAFIFRKYSNEYNTVDYSEPTLAMLKKAALRYEPFQKKTALALIPVIFIDAGFTTYSFYDFNFIQHQVFFLGLMALGVVSGLVVWYYRYKPLRDDILSMIKELNDEGA